MAPSEYASIVVLPTVNEFLEMPGDQRRAYLACVASYHLTDYLAKAEGASKKTIIKGMRGVCANSFDVVQGICNGSKHCGADAGVYRFRPGSEEIIPSAGYGTGFYGHTRYGGAPGLLVEHNGERLLVDFCLRAVLETFGRLYPEHLAGANLGKFALGNS
jgi:hypothetical protein